LIDGYVSYYTLESSVVMGENLGMEFKTVYKTPSQVTGNELIVECPSNEDNYFENFDNYSPKIYTLVNILEEDTTGNIFIYTKEQNLLPTIRDYFLWRGFCEYGTGSSECFVILTVNNFNLLKVINSRSNRYGKHIKYIIGSLDTKIGISLLNVRVVHIMEPQEIYNEFKQIVGRALRLCSHYELEVEERNVKYYLWKTVRSFFIETEEEKIYRKSLQLDLINSSYLNIMRKSAVDRFLWDLTPERGNFSKLIRWLTVAYRPHDF